MDEPTDVSFENVFTSPISVNSKRLPMADSCRSEENDGREEDENDLPGLIRLKAERLGPTSTVNKSEALLTSTPDERSSAKTELSPDCVLDEWPSPENDHDHGEASSVKEQQMLPFPLEKPQLNLMCHHFKSVESEIEKAIFAAAEDATRQFYQSYAHHLDSMLSTLLTEVEATESSSEGGEDPEQRPTKAYDSPMPVSFPANIYM